MSERHDWLNLIEVSGPFLSIPVLDEAFPQGLEGRDKRDAARLRQAYDEWREAIDVEDPGLDELHQAWVDEVLATALHMGDRDLRRSDQVGDALHMSLPEHGITLAPDIVLVNVNDTNKLLLPMFVQPPNAPLDEVTHRDGWAASPAERMVQYLRGVDCPIGLVTNGERWMLVHAPAGQVTSFVSWYARLWSQEPETLRSFASLLAVPRFYGPEEGQLPCLFARSEKHQDEVTEALGDQVRTAIEVLIQAIDKANQDGNGKLLEGVTPQKLYEGGLTVMMRLVFILSAEERGLLLLGNTTYDNHYALSTFRQRLRRVSSNAHELLERRHAGWSRLLALFRAIYGGIEHSDLRLPAMGGSLFDPDRYPFLEGRAKGSSWLTDAADPLSINDRTVLLMLNAIQSFKGRTLSYRALDVEQIGHVYEGLLERTVRQIDEVTLELRGSAQAKSPKATLRELVEASLDGQETLIELLKERTGRSVPALRRDLQRSRDDRLSAALLTACRGDVEMHDRVEPYVHLMAQDPWDRPRLYLPGAYAVVMGNDRRETGTHYTPKSLTEKIVHETLTPVAYIGPAEGKPKEEWQLKSPAELLELKVCDPAMGSGAFLVQACRWLGERLVEAWSQAESSGGVVSVDGEVLESADEIELLPRDAEERTVIARRLVAERCLYGVDMNPLAVELAKLSVWLVTLAEGRPFGFLDHNLRCGDSLLGISRLEQLTELALEPSDVRQSRLFGQSIREALDKALELRRRLRETPIRDIHDVEIMAALDTEARKQLELPEHIADAFIGVILAADSTRMLERRISDLAIQADQAIQGDTETLGVLVDQADHGLARDALDSQLYHPFHWPLEFPEVFQTNDNGFDAIIGNPPFLGGKRITGVFGTTYREWLISAIAEGGRGSADLVAYFFLRSLSLLRKGGEFGLLAVNTIAEGDTRQVGLEPMLQAGAVIRCAYPNEPWPGSASVVISRVHVRNGRWEGLRFLKEAAVPYISAFLSGYEEWTPRRLKGNSGIAYVGSYVNGMGFLLSSEEAQSMLDADQKNSEVIFPYLVGDDLTSDPEQRASRFVINFFDWPEERAKKYRLPYEWIEKHVKPERQRLKNNGEFSLRPPLPQRWWQYADKRPALYHTVGLGHHFEKHPRGWDSASAPLKQVFCLSRVTKYLALAVVPSNQVWSERLIVFAGQSLEFMGLLLSQVHEVWSRKNASTFETRLNYTPSDAFDTFPLPLEYPEGLRKISEAVVEFRRWVGCELKIGLTDLYNKFHDIDDSDGRIEKLRRLHEKIDYYVLSAYGWDDLDLGHDFHEVAYLPESDRVRFTMSENSRIEVLRRLSELNRQRYKEEVDQGLHEKGSSKTSTRTMRANHTGKANAAQPQLDFESGNVVATRGESPTTAILKFLKSHDGWYAKADILNATGIKDGQWSSAINELMVKHAVERQGVKRGARYRAVNKGGFNE